METHFILSSFFLQWDTLFKSTHPIMERVVLKKKNYY
uniref:Uncharacterized protein n=1 Tax=viral metagenome TaxID=1070528 RepID=A0A6C0K2Q3_9ZZZZ